VARRVVFDTNILVSGCLWKGPARRAVETVRSGDSILLMSSDAIEELIRVLAYDNFGLRPDEIQPIIDDLTSISEFVASSSSLPQHNSKRRSGSGVGPLNLNNPDRQVESQDAFKLVVQESFHTSYTTISSRSSSE